MSTTPPTAFFSTASGFTIPNVRSMDIVEPSLTDRARGCERRARKIAVGGADPRAEAAELLHEAGDGLAELGRRRRDGDARLLQRGDLLGGRAFAAADDRARVTHALAGRRRLAGDERRDRLLHVRLREAGGFLLGGA